MVESRATYNIIGVESSERNRGDAKHIKSVKRLHISTEKTEKQLMVYTKIRLEKAKFHRGDLEKLNDACAAWGDENKQFDFGLETFGVEVDDLNIPEVPKRYFCCWVEEWEKPFLKKNDPVARAKLSEKYRGLVLCYIDDVDKFLYTVYIVHMEYGKGKKGGWTVLSETSDYNGTDFNCLDPFQITEDILIYLINNTEQPTINSVCLIFLNGSSNFS